jgi:hypothetical protein
MKEMPTSSQKTEFIINSAETVVLNLLCTADVDDVPISSDVIDDTLL